MSYAKTLVYLRWVRDSATSFDGDPDVISADKELFHDQLVELAVERCRAEGALRLERGNRPFGCDRFEVVVDKVYSRVALKAPHGEGAHQTLKEMGLVP